MVEVGAGVGMASLAWSGLGGEVMAVLDIDAEVLGGYRALNPGVPANRAYVLSAEAVGWLRHPAAVLGVSLHCQPFSTLPREEQKGSGWWDARSWGFHEVCHGLLKLAEECRPKCGYSENLVTWTYALHLEALDALLSVLRACGYEVAVLCTTSEAHGDGQTRWRSYVVFFQCGSGALQRFLGDPPRVRAPILLGGPKGVLASSSSNAAKALYLDPARVHGNLRRERRRSLFTVVAHDYNGVSPCIVSSYGNIRHMPWGVYVDTNHPGAREHSLHLDEICLSSVRRLSVREVGALSGLSVAEQQRLTGNPSWYRWLGAAVTKGAVTELLAAMCRAMGLPHTDVPPEETNQDHNSGQWQWEKQSDLCGAPFYKMRWR